MGTIPKKGSSAILRTEEPTLYNLCVMAAEGLLIKNVKTFLPQSESSHTRPNQSFGKSEHCRNQHPTTPRRRSCVRAARVLSERGGFGRADVFRAGPSRRLMTLFVACVKLCNCPRRFRGEPGPLHAGLTCEKSACSRTHAVNWRALRLVLRRWAARQRLREQVHLMCACRKKLCMSGDCVENMQSVLLHIDGALSCG